MSAGGAGDKAPDLHWGDPAQVLLEESSWVQNEERNGTRCCRIWVYTAVFKCRELALLAVVALR